MFLYSVISLLNMLILGMRPICEPVLYVCLCLCLSQQFIAAPLGQLWWNFTQITLNLRGHFSGLVEILLVCRHYCFFNYLFCGTLTYSICVQFSLNWHRMFSSLLYGIANQRFPLVSSALIIDVKLLMTNMAIFFASFALLHSKITGKKTVISSLH